MPDGQHGYEYGPLLDSIPGPAAVVSAPGLIIAVNTAFAGLLGCRADELAGLPFEGLSDRRAAKSGARPDAPDALFGDGAVYRDMPLTMLDSNGKRVEVLLSARPAAAGFAPPGAYVVLARAVHGNRRDAGDVLSENRELKERVKYLEDFRDGVFSMIKDLDRSEQELENACAKLKDTQAQLIQSSKMNALGELSAGLAHEISQPLTVVKGLAQALLRNPEAPAQEAEKLKLIFDASEKMEQIIRHLRVFSRSEEPELSPVDLNAVVRDAGMIARETLLKHSIELTKDLSDVPLVLGSPTRLEQVLINLITNARDAMPDGGVIAVSTSTEKVRGRCFVLLSLSDTGCGMSEETAPKIFDPFFTTKPSGMGTGLGLSISYGIIKEHNGDIMVRSSPGKGTTFTIRLPALTDEMGGVAGVMRKAARKEGL